MAKKLHLGRWFAGLLIVLVAEVVVFCICLSPYKYARGTWMYDLYRGMNYSPSPEMNEIIEDLDLTSQGKFLLSATQPTLNDSDEFNENCRSLKDEEVVILGCYVNNNIFVYNITESELDGIRELTTAHELLHVVFSRLTNEEKRELREKLDAVYARDDGTLANDLETYEEVSRFEELYVRAGTEIEELPQELEEHYAEIFRNRKKIVAFYTKYIKVFRETAEETELLLGEIKTISAELEAKQDEYEQGVKQLEIDAVNFNSCAKTAGCFASKKDFDNRREALLARQAELNNLYEQIDQLINKYNDNVTKYNENAVYTKKLNRMINSRRPEEDEED